VGPIALHERKEANERDMSAKGAKLRERSQRFRRRLSGKDRAVSPVVATLILILIAVAAASALYLWLVTWQGSITGGIGVTHAQASLTIGGSTSVYPFDEIAVTQFQQNNTDVAISNNQGGSGAGMLAACNGAVMIGAASFPVTVAGLVSTYGCSPSVESTAVVTTVAYDAVDMIVPLSNPHGLLSINYDTVALIYEDATVAAGGHPSLQTLTYDGGVSAPAAIRDVSGINWNQIPAAVGGASLSISVGGGVNAPLTEMPLASPGYGPSAVLCGPSPTVQNDICANAGKSPCGQTICAGGANDTVLSAARSDASGTTQSFEARLLDAASPSTFAAATVLNSPGSAGFNGCGGSNYISDCAYVATKTGNGNPAVVAAVAGSNDAIGYASDGIARSAGTVALIPFVGVGQTANAYPSQTTWYGGILPTTGGSGTIALGIKGPAQGSVSPGSDYVLGYLGWRPFDLVTLNTPSGTAAAFLTFVLDPANNINLAAEAQEVSIYSV